ncbi:MAG: hypothetical protein WCK82_12990, partial [Bacteroidota bacterium]
MAALFALRHSVASIPGFASAIQHYYSDLGWGDLPRGRRWRATSAGLQRFFASVDAKKQAPALPLEAVRKIAQLSSSEAASLLDVVCRAALLFGFWLATRESELFGAYAPPASAVQFLQDGLQVTFRWTKTSDRPKPVYVAKRADDLCLVSALQLYLATAPRAPSPSGPLFVHNGQPLTARVFLAWLRPRARTLLGVPASEAKDFSVHSLRRGMATTMYQEGVAEPVIMNHGRWRSLAVREYLEISSSAAPYMATANIGAKVRDPAPAAQPFP